MTLLEQLIAAGLRLAPGWVVAELSIVEDRVGEETVRLVLADRTGYRYGWMSWVDRRVLSKDAVLDELAGKANALMEQESSGAGA